MGEAQRVIDIIREQLTCSSESLHVLWLKTDADSRAHFAKQLRDGCDDVALVPIVVRERIFVDPNSVLSDLNRVLAGNRLEIEGLGSKARQPVVIVMLSRADGSLSQKRDGRRCSPRDDAFGKAKTSGLDMDGVAGLRGAEPGRSALRDCLAGYRSHVDGLTDPRAYRPSLKTRASILSDLLTLIQRSTPDQLVGLAKSVVAAMGVADEVTSRLPMIAILLRPTMPMDAAVRFCHTLLASVYGGYQFLNATAHASDYPKVSVAFLYLNSRDLRLALQHLAEQMDQMA